jgi:predicted nucleic acid-binding protein
MPMVVDTSVTLSWALEDEASPETDRLLEALLQDTMHVPSLWALEVCNALVMAQRRGRLSPADYLRFLDIVDGLPIAIDETSVIRALTTVLEIATSQRLTAYDTAYLELAFRLGVPLATKDQRLVEAARQLGLRVIP